MAILYKENGTQEEVIPKNGKDFKLAEVKRFLNGGYVEMVSLGNSEVMLLDEDGKNKGLETNPDATKRFQAYYGKVDVIVGNALVCKRSQFK